MRRPIYRNGTTPPDDPKSDLVDDEVSLEEIHDTLGLWANTVRHSHHERASIKGLAWLLFVIIELFSLALQIDDWITWHVENWRIRWRQWWRTPENGENGA